MRTNPLVARYLINPLEHLLQQESDSPGHFFIAFDGVSGFAESDSDPLLQTFRWVICRLYFCPESYGTSRRTMYTRSMLWVRRWH